MSTYSLSDVEFYQTDLGKLNARTTIKRTVCEPRLRFHRHPGMLLILAEAASDNVDFIWLHLLRVFRFEEPTRANVFGAT